MDYKKAALLLVGLFIITLALMGVTAIWAPGMINAASFIKVGASFAVLLLLTLVGGFVINQAGSKKPDTSVTDDKSE